MNFLRSLRIIHSESDRQTTNAWGPNMNEAEAIARLKRGDIGGLETLVKLHYVHAVRTVYLISRDRELAEDIVQAAFLRVYERVDQFDAQRPFAPWFLRSVVNDARMSARKQEHVVPLDAASRYNEAGVPELAAKEIDLDDMLIAAETSEVIWEALGKLSAEQRSAIVLRYYLDLSEAEMSDELDCPPGTVKSRLHTARRRLRELLPSWLGPSANG
jgi:RNA polymerase sigma-70 factor, ECF subfamily